MRKEIDILLGELSFFSEKGFFAEGDSSLSINLTLFGLCNGRHSILNLGFILVSFWLTHLLTFILFIIIWLIKTIKGFIN